MVAKVIRDGSRSIRFEAETPGELAALVATTEIDWGRPGEMSADFDLFGLGVRLTGPVAVRVENGPADDDTVEIFHLTEAR